MLSYNHMKNTRKAIFTGVVFYLMGFTSFSQQDFTLYNMPQVPQSSHANPSTIPNAKVNISLPLLVPNIYYSGSNSGFRLADAFQRRDDDSLVINMENMLSKLKPKNYLVQNLDIELLNVGVRIKEKNYVSFSVIEKLNATVTYPKDLFVLIWEGNGKSLLGNRTSFDGLGLDFNHYREYGIQYARKVDDKLTIGGKLKYLYGMENIWTETSEIGLTTDASSFDLEYDVNMAIHTSGFAQYADTNNSVAFSASNYLFGKQNKGYGLDVGARYKLNDQIELSASIVDFGRITWKDDTKNYNVNGSFKFTGLDILDLFASVDTSNIQINNNDTASATELLIDSIRSSIEFDDNTESYTTRLPTKIYAGGTFALNENNKIGLLGYGIFTKGRFRPALSASYNLTVKKWFSASVSYSVYQRGYSNLGLGFAINGGFFQFYMVTDNALWPFYPDQFRNGHLRTGVNYTIGRRAKKASGD